MNATPKPAEHQPPVSKVLVDRIPADGEQVAHTLDPFRRPDKVRYPDPEAPRVEDDALTLAPQSNAEIQMARRTDAGPREAARDYSGEKSSVLLWVLGAAGLVVVIAAVVALA